MLCLGEIEDEDIRFVYESDICRITMIVANKHGIKPFLREADDTFVGGFSVTDLFGMHVRQMSRRKH